MVAEKYLVRHFLEDLDNEYRLPGLGTPADGAAKVKSRMIPWLRPLGSGAFRAGIPGPLTGVSPNERAER